MILPSYYKKWLDSIDTDVEVSYRGSEFYLLSERELIDEITIDRNTVKAFNQLSAFIKTQLEMSGSSPLTIEQCNTCITIGKDNGNPIFIDSTRDSELFCYYLDGGYIEAKGGNLLSLVIEAKKHITNSSRGIQHAWHFWYALALVSKCHAGTSVLRASPLNWAL